LDSKVTYLKSRVRTISLRTDRAIGDRSTRRERPAHSFTRSPTHPILRHTRGELPDLHYAEDKPDIKQVSRRTPFSMNCRVTGEAYFNAKMGMCSLRLNLTLTSRSIPPQLFPTIPKLDGRNVPRAATPASSWNPLTVSQSWSILDSLSFDIPSPLFLSNTETSLPSLTACEL